MDFHNISALGEFIVRLIVSGVFVYIGIHLLRNNEIITINMLKNASIFDKKEKSMKDNISSSKIKFNRIMVCIVGIVFIAFGGKTLISLLL